MNLNQLNLIGRVGSEIELKTMPSGKTVAKFSLATNYSYKKGEEKIEETEWHNIVAFGKVADILARYVVKGQILFVSGRLKTDAWDGKDGQKKYWTNVILEKFNFGPKPKGSEDQAPRQASSGPAPIEYPSEEDENTGNQEVGDVNPEEIPF